MSLVIICQAGGVFPRRTIIPETALETLILKQYYLGCLAHASYLIGDPQSGIAVIVDPQRDVDRYIDDARRLSLKIRHVFLTHFHADFVAGHLELRDLTGATIHLGARAKAEYDFVPMHDSDTLSLGTVTLRVLETPGHSPESICIHVIDSTGTNPGALLTGDTLFIGDVGRPDLRALIGWSAEELGGMLYDSLTSKILPLPDDTLIYPTHGAGSLCGKSIGKETVSTLGIQRKYNYALQPMTRDQFIALVTADQPEAPDYFAYDAALNTRERQTLDTMLDRAKVPLSVATVLGLRDQGAQILDVRECSEFEAAHLQGALNISLRGQYASWAGTLLGRDKPLVIIAPPHAEEEATVRLGRIGFDHVAGYLEGGMEALDSRAELLASTERITAPALGEWLESGKAPLLLDVRREGEWNAGHIGGSRHLPLHQLPQRLSEIPANSPVVVYCATGYRSAIGASLLQRTGHPNVIDLVGGISAWEAARLPVVQP